MNMFTRTDYDEAITGHMLTTAAALKREFQKLRRVAADLPSGEMAYKTLTRTASEWRLPVDTPNLGMGSEELLMLPVRDEYYTNNAYLAVVPQPIIMHRQVAKVLEAHAKRFFQHFPEEDSLARREHGVPMLIGRFDVIVDKQGNIQICELDDVCSLWPALPKINPIAETYLRALEDQLRLPIYTAELFQYTDGAFAVSPRARKEYARISFYDDAGIERVAYIPRTISLEMAILRQNGLTWRESQKITDRDTAYYEGLLRRAYMHNEDHWRGDISDAWLLQRKNLALDDVALSVRAYRDMPGFQEHLDRYGSRSISMAWNRDSKWSLVAEKLAVLAADLDTAVEFGKLWQSDHPSELLVFKTLYGARTEGTAIFSSRGTKQKGVSSAAQIAKKFGSSAQQPIVIQPYKEPDSLAEAGIRFIGSPSDNEDNGRYADRKLIRSVAHIGSPNPGERVLVGQEHHFSMIFRSFVIYLPKEKRLVHVGGMWQATDGRIVHGGSHSVAGPLYIDGLMGHPDIKQTETVRQSEAMLKRYGYA
jgi:hypothetical protein